MFITMPTQTATTTGQFMGGAPPPPPATDEFVQQVEAAIQSGALDVDALEAKLISAFGDEAEGIVSEDGEVDYEALSSLLVEKTAERTAQHLTDKFGEDAAQFVTEDGAVDHEGLVAWLDEQGVEAPSAPPPPPPGSTSNAMAGYGQMAPDSEMILSFIEMLA